MTEGERLFVRVDATLKTGLGHFNRCLAIAQCWREAVGPVTFIGQYVDALNNDLAEEQIDIEVILSACPASVDIETTTALIPDHAAVILDGYHFDSAYQERLARNRRLLVVDDIGHLASYAGSFLLNANVYADEINYSDAPAIRLLGLQYALLRRSFRRDRTTPRTRTSPVKKLLVCLGGADAANDTLTVLQALWETALPSTRIRTVVGPLNPHADSLERFAESTKTIEIVRTPTSMCAELTAADFVIAGAGTISAELAFLGKPSLLVAIADNQLATGPRLQQAGAANYGGDLRKLNHEQLVTTITDALSDAKKQETMRMTGPTLVDGQGAVRICKILSGAPHDRSGR